MTQPEQNAAELAEGDRMSVGSLWLTRCKDDRWAIHDREYDYLKADADEHPLATLEELRDAIDQILSQTPA